jgi:hypothetical protein
MSLRHQPLAPVPEDTARVARAAFPKGNPYLTLRDQLGTVFQDEDFAALFPVCGQPSLPPLVGGGTCAKRRRRAGRRGRWVRRSPAAFAPHNHPREGADEEVPGSRGDPAHWGHGCVSRLHAPRVYRRS